MLRAALAVALVAVPAVAKPITVHVDAAVTNALLIAEVEILEVRPAGFMGRRGGRGGIRVRVTRDPRRIHRGAQHCGRELELVPFRSGPARCTAFLAPLKGKGPVLLVVDRNRVVWLAGERKGDGYGVRSWCDFNACWLRCDDAALAVRDGGRRGSHFARLKLAGLRERFREQGRAFWAKVAPFLCGVEGPLAPDRLELLLAQLNADSPAVREKAQRVLVQHGAFYLAELERAHTAAGEPEERRRIRAVLDQLDGHARAAVVARTLPDDETRRWVVREALPSLEGREKEAARAFLDRR